jgi:hypothetical protein
MTSDHFNEFMYVHIAYDIFSTLFLEDMIP